MRLSLILAAFLAATAVQAGTSNLDRLDIQAEASGGDILRVLDSSGNEQAVFEEDGTFDLSGASDVNLGSVVLSGVTSKTILIPALSMHSTGSVEVVNGKATWAIADASADEFVYATFILPGDLDSTNSLGFVQVEYLCDQASPTEGEFNVSYGGFADDDADAALTSLGNLLDTSPAQNDWSVTTIGATSTIPAAALTAGETFYLSVGHDVTDQFCGGSDINVASLRFTYTTDKNQ